MYVIYVKQAVPHYLDPRSFVGTYERAVDGWYATHWLAVNILARVKSVSWPCTKMLVRWPPASHSCGRKSACALFTCEPTAMAKQATNKHHVFIARASTQRNFGKCVLSINRLITTKTKQVVRFIVLHWQTRKMHRIWCFCCIFLRSYTTKKLVFCFFSNQFESNA